MTKEFVGQIGTDVASFLLIDPCLLNDPEAKKERIPKLEKGIKREQAEGNYERAANLKRIQTQAKEMVNLTTDWAQYCNDVTKESVRKYAGGIIVSTGADGGFNVYVHKNKYGEITKLVLEL